MTHNIAIDKDAMTDNIAIGIDPSKTNTGLCIIGYTPDFFTVLHRQTIQDRERTINPKSGKERWTQLDIPSTLHKLYRTLDIVIEGTLQKYPTTKPWICVETPFIHPKNVSGGMIQMAAYGVAVALARDFCKDVITTEPSVIKKFFTGSGNASKDMMRGHLNRSSRYNSLIGKADYTDDEVDAFAIAEYVYHLKKGLI